MTLDQIKIQHDTFVLKAKEFAEATSLAQKNATQLEQTYTDNLANVSQSTKHWEKDIITKYEDGKKDANKDYDEQYKLLNNQFHSAKDSNTKQSYAKMLEAIEVAYKVKLNEIEEIKNSNEENLKANPDIIKKSIEDDFNAEKTHLIGNYEKIHNEFIEELNSFFGSRYETSPSSNHTFWANLKTEEEAPISFTTYGYSTVACKLFDKSFRVDIPHMVPFLNGGNIIIKCDNLTKQKALDLAAGIILRNLLAIYKDLKLHLVDTESMTKNFGELRLLNDKIYNRYVTESNAVREKLDFINNVILDISTKLTRDTPSLFDFNKKALVTKPYHLLFLSNLILDCGTTEGMQKLLSILSNGLNAGVSCIMILNIDLLNTNEEEFSRNKGNISYIDQFSKFCSIIDLNSNIFKTNLYGLEMTNKIESILDFKYQNVIDFINEKINKESKTSVLYKDYLINEDKWWNKNNKEGIVSNIGVLLEESNKLFQLKLGLNQDDFSCLICGKPGTGKSSLYHTFLSDTMINYSPKEVQFYLIDMKGTEFAIYANEDVFTPHISVVASNSEREFALNVIDELIKLGEERSRKYKSFGVNGLIKYNEKCAESEKDPIVILMIDEFVQLFNSSDKLSNVALSGLLKIVQVYRAHGILFVAAFQTLSTTSISLSNLIDLIPIRIVHKAADSDNQKLLKESNSFNSEKGILTKLDKVGQFIFNNNGGMESASNKHKLVQSLFIPNPSTVLSEIAIFSKNKLQSSEKYKTRVYDLEKLAKFENNKAMDNLEKIRSSSKLEIYLGQAMSLAVDDVYFDINIENSSNILILGGENHQIPCRLFFNTILSLMFNLSFNELEFIIINGLSLDDDTNSRFDELIKETEYQIRDLKFGEVHSQIAGIKDEIEFLISKNEQSKVRKILCFIASDSFNFGLDEKNNKFLQSNMKTILSKGPLVGYHSIIQFNSSKLFENIFNYDCYGYFKHNIAFQMDSSDASRFVKDDRPVNLIQQDKSHTENYGYYYLKGSTKVQKFNTYDWPSKQWYLKKLNTVNLNFRTFQELQKNQRQISNSSFAINKQDIEIEENSSIQNTLVDATKIKTEKEFISAEKLDQLNKEFSAKIELMTDPLDDLNLNNFETSKDETSKIKTQKEYISTEELDQLNKVFSAKIELMTDPLGEINLNDFENSKINNDKQIGNND